MEIVVNDLYSNLKTIILTLNLQSIVSHCGASWTLVLGNLPDTF